MCCGFLRATLNPERSWEIRDAVDPMREVREAKQSEFRGRVLKIRRLQRALRVHLSEFRY